MKIQSYKIHILTSQYFSLTFLAELAASEALPLIWLGLSQLWHRDKISLTLEKIRMPLPANSVCENSEYENSESENLECENSELTNLEFKIQSWKIQSGLGALRTSVGNSVHLV